MIKIKKAFGKSKGGYFHFPILGFSFGKNGVMVSFLGLNIMIRWE